MIFREQRINKKSILNILPIMEKNENYFKPNNVIILESRFGNNLINFSEVYEIAKYNDISILEIVKDIISSHKNLYNNEVFLINEARYYTDTNYRNSVLEIANYYPIQFYKLNYENYFNNLLETIIELDLSNGNTRNTDLLLLEFLNLDNIKNKFSLEGLEDLINTATSTAEKTAGQASDFLKKSAMDKAMSIGNFALEKLDANPELKDKANKFFSDTSMKTASELFNTAKNAASNAIDKNLANTIKNTNVGTLVGGAIGTAGVLASHAPEGAINTVTEKLTKAKNAIMDKINNLLGKQKDAPPEQKGIIGNLISKLRNILSSITSKLSGVKNQQIA